MNGKEFFEHRQSGMWSTTKIYASNYCNNDAAAADVAAGGGGGVPGGGAGSDDSDDIDINVITDVTDATDATDVTGGNSGSVDGGRTQVKLHLRRCILQDYENFEYAFPEFATHAEIHRPPSVCNRSGEDGGENIDATTTNRTTSGGRNAVEHSRRWSVDEDYGFDDAALDAEDSQCDTQ